MYNSSMYMIVFVICVIYGMLMKIKFCACVFVVTSNSVGCALLLHCWCIIKHLLKLMLKKGD